MPVRQIDFRTVSVSRRVLVLDRDEPRRDHTCSLLERAGYDAIGASAINDLDAWLDDGEMVILVEVSLPRSWDDVLAEEAALRPFVDERCPIVLYGDRPASELSELAWATRATAHSTSDASGAALVALMRRVLPLPSAGRARTPLHTTHVERRPVRLLLVDDSEMTLELMQDLLAKRGFDVRIAIAHGEVRSLVSTWAPQVIVADVKRPDVPGAELCTRLKEGLGVHGEVVVLLSSSVPQAELAALARSAGADGWVSKRAGLERFVDEVAAQTKRILEARRDAHNAAG